MSEIDWGKVQFCSGEECEEHEVSPRQREWLRRRTPLWQRGHMNPAANNTATFWRASNAVRRPPFWQRITRVLIIIELIQLLVGAVVGSAVPWIMFFTNTGWYAPHG